MVDWSEKENKKCTTSVTRCCGLSWFESRRACGKCGRNFHPEIPPPEPVREWLKPPEPALPDLAARLRSWRLRRHMTQQQLANKMGTSRTIILRYEGRTIYPELRNIGRIAAALDITVNDLLEPDPILRELMRKRLNPDKRREILEAVKGSLHG